MPHTGRKYLKRKPSILSALSYLKTMKQRQQGGLAVRHHSPSCTVRTVRLVLRVDAPDRTLLELPGRALAPRRLAAGLPRALGAGLLRLVPGRLPPASPPLAPLSFNPSSFSTCSCEGEHGTFLPRGDGY